MQQVPSGEVNGILPPDPVISTYISSFIDTGSGITHCPTALTINGPDVGVVIVVRSVIVKAVVIT